MELSERILGSFYKPEVIHTQKVERIEDKKVRVTYAFPPYQRTIEDMGHVGMSQMNEGLVEGLYCAIGYAIDANEIQVGITIDDFIVRMREAIFEREGITFRKMLKFGEFAELEIEVGEIQEKIRGRYYGIILSISGFLRGEVECWLPKNPSGH